MKFIHTADWQLGMAFGQVQDKAEILRQARIDAIKQVVALAEKEKVDFVIAAGDLFEGNRIWPHLVEEMASAVKRCPVPIYLLPGNHDPLTQDSPYIRCPDLFGAPAVVLRSDAPIAIAGGTLFPCPALSKYSSKDPTAWIPPRQDADGIRVGIAHGSVGTPTPNDFPIPAKAALQRDVDYLALGHWHGTKEIDDRTWYCGTPEPTGFGENDSGNVLLVEISAAKSLPKIRKIPLAQYTWMQLEREVHNAEELDHLVTEVEQLQAARTLLCLKVNGSLPQTALDRLQNLEMDRFFHFRVESSVALSNGTPHYRHPLLQEMTNLLAAKTSSPDPEDAEAARRALSKLSSLVKFAGFRTEDV